MKRLLLVLALVTAALVPAGAASATAGLTWTAPQFVDPPHGGFTSISCVSATWCRAGDAHGTAWNWNGARWAAGTSFGDPAVSELTGMDCVSTTFCVAALATHPGEAGPGQIEMFDGAHWRSYSSFAGEAEASNQAGGISCPSTTFCMLSMQSGGQFYYRVWDGHTWTAKQVGGGLSVACWAANRCRAVEQAHVERWYGAGWGAHNLAVPVGRTLTAIDCPEALFCVAADDAGGSYAYHAPDWTGPESAAPVAIATLACPSTSACVALTRAGSSVAYVAARDDWTAPHLAEPGGVIMDLTCPGTGFCAAVSYTGDVATRLGSHWGAARRTDPLVGGPTAVSCAGPTFCALVDRNGGVATYDGSSWSRPARVLTQYGRGLYSVSCPTATFCLAWVGQPEVLADRSVAINGVGFAVMRDGVWSSAPAPAGGDFADRTGGLSCTAPTFCLAIWAGVGQEQDGYTRYVAWTGAGWGPVRQFDNGDAGAVSCAVTTCLLAHDAGVTRWADGALSDTGPLVGAPNGIGALSCWAVDECLGLTEHFAGPGTALRWNGTSWSDAATPAGGLPNAVISCASAQLCAAIGDRRAATWDGSAWSATVSLPVTSLTGVSCAAGRCVAVDQSGLVVTES